MWTFTYTAIGGAESEGPHERLGEVSQLQARSWRVPHVCAHKNIWRCLLCIDVYFGVC